MMNEKFIERFFKTVSFSLGVDQSSLTIDLSKDDIPEWDSLGHLKLLLGFEEEFEIKFSMEETEKFSSLRDMCNLIATKIIL